jgi:hypothetical protein
VLIITFLLGFTNKFSSVNYTLARQQSGIFLAPLPGIEEEDAPTSTTRQKHFSGVIAGEKEDFCKESLSLPIFYFVNILLYFIFACILGDNPLFSFQHFFFYLSFESYYYCNDLSLSFLFRFCAKKNL